MGLQRMDNRLDGVRRACLRVIPVLIEGATMPAPADVPLSLQPLCYRTAVPVRPDPDFRTDMERLVAALGVPGDL